MDIDYSTLQRLMNLDDDSFRSLVYQISETVGADKRKTEIFASDVDRVKRMVSQVTPEEADKLIGKIGKDKAEQILEIIKEK